MNDNRKKPSVTFWATVVVAVALVGYPLSFGPACWMARAGRISRDIVADVYRPVIRIANRMPSPIRSLIASYSGPYGSLNLGFGTTMLDHLTLELDGGFGLL